MNKDQKTPLSFTNSVIYFLLSVYNHRFYLIKTKKTLKAVLLSVEYSLQSAKPNSFDSDLLKSILSSAPFNFKLIYTILNRLNQMNLASGSDTIVDVIPQNLQLYALYTNLDYPSFSDNFIKEYIDNQIRDSYFPNLLLLAYLGLAIMDVKLC